MTLGKRLAAQRKQKGLTQQQLGEQLNVSAQAVSKWENDQAEPDLSTVCKLAALYQISVDSLLTDGDKSITEPNPAILVKNPVPEKTQPYVDTQNDQTKSEDASSDIRRNKKTSIIKKNLRKGARSVGIFLKKYWTPSAILLCTAMVAVTLILFVQLYAFDIFNIGTVEKVCLDMTTDQVTDLLGDPDDTASAAAGGTTWIYRNWKYRMADLPDQADNTSEALKKIQKLEDKTYKQIKIEFNESGLVCKVRLDTNHRFSMFENDYATLQKNVAKTYFAPDFTVHYPGVGTPWAEMITGTEQAELVYEDGSYAK